VTGTSVDTRQGAVPAAPAPTGAALRHNISSKPFQPANAGHSKRILETKYSHGDCSAVASGPSLHPPMFRQHVSVCLTALRFRDGHHPTAPAGRFALVRTATLVGQTTAHSRTASLSPASGVFIPENPLRPELLEAMCSAHFHDFHALKALGGSYPLNALTRTYTLLLHPTHSSFPALPVHSVRVASCNA